MQPRVAYFADFGSPHRPYTGGYRFAALLLEVLRKLPIELKIFAPTCRRIDQGATLATGQIDLIDLPTLGFGLPRVGLAWAWQLRQRLRHLPKQDLYIFDQPVTLLQLLPPVPAMAMFHGSDVVPWRELSLLHPRALFRQLCWQKPVIGRLQRQFLSRTVGLPLFNSRDTLRRLYRDFGFDPAPLEQFVTYLPVDTAQFRFDAGARQRLRQKYGITPNEIVVIALSNFDSTKRPDRLRAVTATFLERFPDQPVRFLFIGGGRQAGALEAITANPAFVRQCLRVGEIPAADVPAFYSVADIALSTSQRESFGYTIAEGMAIGLPFVAYRGGAIEEVIEHGATGFVVDELDQFVNALATLASDEELRQRFGAAGKERVESKFSVGAFRDRLQLILRNEFQLIS